MPLDHDQQFAVLVFLGIGLVASACTNLALRTAGTWCRALASSVIAGLVVAACALHEPDAKRTTGVAIALFGSLAILMLLGSDIGRRTLTNLLGQPSGVWRVAGFLGATMIAVATARHQSIDEERLDTELRELSALDTLKEADEPQFEPVTDVRASTDAGTPVELLRRLDLRPAAFLSQVETELFQSEWRQDDVIRTALPDDRVNCYGWLFTGGRYWIPGSAMGTILRENGYKPVKEPAVGDLVAYRSGDGIAHLGVVRYVSANRPPLVEGKWGASGVFLHQVDRSIYGREYAYLRSPRPGHLLAGIPDARTE